MLNRNASSKKKVSATGESSSLLGGSSSPGGILGSKKTLRRRRFDYVDPVEDFHRKVKNTPMANTTMMKFHEMKVEREPFNTIDR